MSTSCAPFCLAPLLLRQPRPPPAAAQQTQQLCQCRLPWPGRFDQISPSTVTQAQLRRLSAPGECARRHLLVSLGSLAALAPALEQLSQSTPNLRVMTGWSTLAALPATQLFFCCPAILSCCLPWSPLYAISGSVRWLLGPPRPCWPSMGLEQNPHRPCLRPGDWPAWPTCPHRRDRPGGLHPTGARTSALGLQ